MSKNGCDLSVSLTLILESQIVCHLKPVPHDTSSAFLSPLIQEERPKNCFDLLVTLTSEYESLKVNHLPIFLVLLPFFHIQVFQKFFFACDKFCSCLEIKAVFFERWGSKWFTFSYYYMIRYDNPLLIPQRENVSSRVSTWCTDFTFIAILT